MAKDRRGVWWPARLCTKDELEQRKNYRISQGESALVRTLSSL